MSESKKVSTTTITIDDPRFDKRAPVGVNGRVQRFAVGKPIEVDDEQLEALRNAGVKFSAPAGKGGAESGVGTAPSTFVKGDNDPDADTETNLTTTKKAAAKTGADNGGKGDGKPADEPGLLDKSIPDLTKAVAEINDVAEIDKLIAAEKGGKSRTGAMEALEARKAELEKPAE